MKDLQTAAGRLDILARARPDRLKALADVLLDLMPDIEVLASRSGLVMLPMRDTARGVDFHLGEVLVAEAHLRAGAAQGYGMVVGRDLERAMAMAVVDAADALGLSEGRIDAFLADEAAAQADADAARLRRIEATRVEMETF